MVVAAGLLDLRIRDCASLKEKRSVVKRLSASLRGRFNVSVAEVDHLELRQRAAIGVSCVGRDGYQVRRVLHQVGRHVDAFPEIEVLRLTVSIHSPED